MDNELSAPAWERQYRAEAAEHLRAGSPQGPGPEAIRDAVCDQFGSHQVPNGPCERWVATFSAPSPHRDADADGVITSPDGRRVFVAGTVEGPGGWPDLDVLTLAYDAETGTPLWSASYAGSTGGYDSTVPLQPIEVSPDGTTVYVAAGSAAGDGVAEFVTIAYDAATGSERWRAQWNGPGHRLDFAYHVVASPDGDTVYVGGDSGRLRGDYWYYDAAIVAYDAQTGTERWSTMYADPVDESDFADGLVPSPDGEALYLTTGSSETCGECEGGIDQNMVTVAFRTKGPARGTPAWRSSFPGGFDLSQRPTASALTADGRTIAVTGLTDSASGMLSYATVAYDTETGTRRWSAIHDNGSDDISNDVEFSPDGTTVFVTGESVRENGSIVSGFDFATIAYDTATGEERWIVRDSFDSQWWTNQPDRAEAITVTPNGKAVVVTGSSVGARHEDYWTIAYDTSSGARLWSARLDGHLDVDRPAAITTHGQTIYVTGASHDFDPEAPDSSTSQATTVAYPLVRTPFP